MGDGDSKGSHRAPYIMPNGASASARPPREIVPRLRNNIGVRKLAGGNEIYSSGLRAAS